MLSWHVNKELSGMQDPDFLSGHFRIC